MINKQKNKWSVRGFASILSVIMLVGMLAACTGITGSEEPESRVLRIGVVEGSSYSNEYLRTQYTDAFELLNPHIEIEVVSAVDYESRRYSDNQEDEPDSLEEMEKLMTGDNPPDLVVLDYSELGHFINQNLLTPLDSYIVDDEFDIDGYVPAVIEGLKTIGNNNLYALAPQFTASALIYNRNIFEQAGVEPPTDNMTWNQVFDLARRVSTGEGTEKTYGFNFTPNMYSDVMDNLNIYTAPLNLEVMDENKDNMLISSQQWHDVWNTIIGLYQDEVIPTREKMYELREEIEESGSRFFSSDLFLSGKLAMAVINYYQLNEIITANRNAANIEGFDGIPWDVVTVPVHEEYPNVGGFVDLSPIMAINANASNPEDAWELIKFINSEEWAELKSRSTQYLLSREDYIKPIDGLDYNINAFTQLIPAEDPNNQSFMMYDYELYWSINNMGEVLINRVVNDDLSLEEALQQWQTMGDALLKAVKENPDMEIWELQNQIMMESMEGSTGEGVIKGVIKY